MNKTKMFPVVILAGGLATRLRPLTEKIPKALLPVKGEPFIAHQLRLLKKQGVEHVVICIGYLGEQIIDFVEDGSEFGLCVDYAFDGVELLGTGGAIKEALPLLTDNFLVLYGDSYLSCDYAAVQNHFIESQKSGLMTVFKNNGQWDKSNVVFEDGAICLYDKKMQTPNMHYIDYGLGIFNRKAFDLIATNQAYDLASLYQELLRKDELAGFEVKQRFYEVGSFEGIKELEAFL